MKKRAVQYSYFFLFFNKKTVEVQEMVTVHDFPLILDKKFLYVLILCALMMFFVICVHRWYVLLPIFILFAILVYCA